MMRYLLVVGLLAASLSIGDSAPKYLKNVAERESELARDIIGPSPMLITDPEEPTEVDTSESKEEDKSESTKEEESLESESTEEEETLESESTEKGKCSKPKPTKKKGPKTTQKKKCPKKGCQCSEEESSASVEVEGSSASTEEAGSSASTEEAGSASTEEAGSSASSEEAGSSASSEEAGSSESVEEVAGDDEDVQGPVNAPLREERDQHCPEIETAIKKHMKQYEKLASKSEDVEDEDVTHAVRYAPRRSLTNCKEMLGELRELRKKLAALRS